MGLGVGLGVVIDIDQGVAIGVDWGVCLDVVHKIGYGVGIDTVKNGSSTMSGDIQLGPL